MKRAAAPIVFIVITAAITGAARAQTPDVFLRGVPSGTATTEPASLSLRDAIARGLDHNLGPLLQEQRVAHAEGTRWRSLSELLPHVSGALRDSRQLVNIAAYGFTAFPGLPGLIGPYSVFDARLAVTTPVLDLEHLNQLRADRASVEAERHDLQHARELVLLVVANLYLEAVADGSRADAARAEAHTAEALYTLAEDQRAAGVVAGIDVVRQQVQRAAAQQKVIAIEGLVQQDLLKLERAIGLPADQKITLTDAVPYSAAPEMTLDQAVVEASANREDVKGAEARAESARAARQAAAASAYPTVHVDGDYGALGTTVSDAKWTYAVGASVRVPIFQGGAVKGRIAQAEADLREREAELADLRGGVRYDVQAALLELNAAAAAVEVARGRDALARQQLDQAEDRFRAGVGTAIELAQAQDAVAAGAEGYIESLYAHNVAKATLARALGVTPERFSTFVGGR